MEVLSVELRLPLGNGLLITLLPWEGEEDRLFNPWELDCHESHEFDQEGHLGRDGEWW
ncbi:MAG: hypothetical protein N2315_02805 [Thermanaerothrix sp.]|nr:hypothetical protein [Thermanaerothrix sp.]